MLDLLDPSLISSFLDLADISEPVPEDSEVKAGYVALFLWLGMAVAVGLLGWSLIRQFRKTAISKAKGLYGDKPTMAPDGTPIPDDGSEADERP
ncbi:hypothetical protein [Nocardioides gilvus]|uniref:hypothetical protein n=1 Tax=Nocardioides gilvus TaxID=1735589 RepID=UPI000D747970|nr:hypothetical protein [Nocardioides gilvus]